MTTKWTVVQHTGYAIGEDPTFARGVESRAIRTLTEARLVSRVGGVIFDTYNEAEDFCEAESYIGAPAGRLVPRVPGTFAKQKIDGLPIYVPALETAQGGS